MKGSILLYIIEGSVPVLTFLLVWAGIAAIKKDHKKHKKLAVYHAIATWSSVLLVVLLVKLGFSLGKGAAPWILEIHLYTIYLIPPLLALLMITGLKGIRPAHLPLAGLYAINWLAALATGAMIFGSVRGLI